MARSRQIICMQPCVSSYISVLASLMMNLIFPLGTIVLCCMPRGSTVCHVTAFATVIPSRGKVHKMYPMTSVVRSSFAATEGGDDLMSPESPSPLANTIVTGEDIRKIFVTNADGESVQLGSLMGPGTCIVVFLRHLGCFNCWSYAREWSLLKGEIERSSHGQNDIVGPIYVSIGDKDRLNAFLDKNPNIPRSQMVVDGYDFAAYKKAGFGRFDEKPNSVTDKVEPKPIILGGVQGWWNFLTSFAPLAPVTPDMGFPEMLTPEGLFWVGGTMVVKGNEVVYRWDDRISGDHPDGGAAKVLQIARETAASSDPRKLSPWYPLDIFKK